MREAANSNDAIDKAEFRRMARASPVPFAAFLGAVVDTFSGKTRAGKSEFVSTADNIIAAAMETGEDGAGKHGLLGYVVRIARLHPRAYVRLLDRVLRVQELRRKKGISPEINTKLIEAIVLAGTRLGKDGKGGDGLGGYLARIAVIYPKSFFTVFTHVVDYDLDANYKKAKVKSPKPPPYI